MSEVAVSFDPVEELKGAFPVIAVAREGLVYCALVEIVRIRLKFWVLGVEMGSGSEGELGASEKRNCATSGYLREHLFFCCIQHTGASGSIQTWNCKQGF